MRRVIRLSKVEKYRELFSSDFLMGPNSLRILDEMLEKHPIEKGLRLLDLGCGKGLTSLYLAKETDANIFAVDLWISATDNFKQFMEWGIEDKVIPIHTDANDLPFADEYFDVIISIDSFHYFATQPNFFQEKILPLLKPNGVAVLAMPGLAKEIHGSEPELLLEWVNGEEGEYELFHSREWWLEHIGQSEQFEIVKAFNLDCFKEAWKDWFTSKHLYAIHDEKYFEKGVDKYLSTVGLVIKKR